MADKKQNNQLTSLSTKPSEEALEDADLPGTSAMRKAASKAAYKAPALRARATRQPYSLAVTTRAASRRISGKTMNTDDSHTTGKITEPVTVVEESSLQAKTEETKVLPSPPHVEMAIVTPAEETKHKTGPFPAVMQERRKGTKEEVAEWKALSRGLSESRVKKYWKLINEGLSGPMAREEATRGYVPKKAQIPAIDTTQRPKTGNPVVKPGGSEAQPLTKSPAKALAGVKMAVYAKDTPVQTLTRDQLTWISEAIMDQVLEEEIVKVKFVAIAFRPWALCIDCANEESAIWLAKTVTALAGWTGPKLLATTADRAPKPTIIQILFPRSADKEAEGILKMLDHQNEGLSVGSWKVVREQVEGEAKRLVAYVDNQSLDAIKRQGFQLSYRYGKVGVRLRHKDKAPEAMDLAVGRTKSTITG